MEYQHYIVFVLLFISGVEVDSYRADFMSPLSSSKPTPMIQQQQGCVWSTLNNNIRNASSSSSVYPPFLQRSSANFYSVSCNVRSLNTDFLNYGTLSREQVEYATRLDAKCNNDKVMPSVLSSNQSLFQLKNLQVLKIESCSIFSIQKNVFCGLKNLATLNISNQRLTDLEELFSAPLRNEENSCSLRIQTLDLSFGLLRQLNANAFSKLGRTLMVLKLQNNLIELLEDDCFSGLKELRVLDLSSSKRLVAIPPTTFTSLRNLRELYLQNSSLSVLSPNLFRGLSQLRVLNLSFNQLKYIDANIFKDLPLEELYLESNSIESINPNAFQTLTHLIVLNLSHNRIQTVDSRLFSKLQIQRLYLDFSNITEIDVDALPSSLEDLGISNNLLTEVPQALKTLNRLVTLDIGENPINTINTTSFDGLNQLYGLRAVGLGIVSIPEKLCSSMRNLRVLNLSNNKIKSPSFSTCSELRVLRLDQTYMEELPTLKNLQKLLWLNASSSMIKILDFNKLPTSLEWLSVNNNQIQAVISDAEVPSLRVLDVSNNLLTEIDHHAISPLHRLESLNLNNNPHLRTVGKDTFSRSSNLRRVMLTGCDLGHLPLESLRIPRVPEGKPLPEFYVGRNNFTCNAEMEYLTKINTQLSVLRTFPHVADLENVICRPTLNQNQFVPLVEMASRNIPFLSPYKSHCQPLCACCDFEFCDCANKCPDACTCHRDTIINIVQCSSNFTQIPASIPLDATSLYLDGNSFSEGLRNFTFIGRKQRLRLLHLNNSGISEVQKKAFNSLDSLETLNLQNNFITNVEFEIPLTLRELNVRSNRLSDFNAVVELAYKLNSLDSIMISGNPFSCNTVQASDCEWVAASKVFVDFAQTTCVEDDKVNVHHQPEKLIMQICDQFNFNHDESDEILNSNHIAEKVAASNDLDINIPHNDNNNNHHYLHPNFPSINNNIAEAEEAVEEESSGDLWTIFTVILCLIIIVLLFVVCLVFRKENSLIPMWLYSVGTSSCCGGGNDEESPCNRGLFSIFCCGESGTGHKKARSTGSFGMDDCDSSLFSAYFIYSRYDEDLLLHKLAPVLETPAASGNALNYRLCLHYRDLCLRADNPLNRDIMVTACDASKRVVLVISNNFLNELSNPGVRSAIQAAIARQKLILILLPPITDHSLHTIYPELKSGQFSSVEWSDKNFWSKFKLLLPTPSITSPSGLNSMSTISSNNSSAYHHHHNHHHQNFNNALSLEYAYNTINSYHHRNIMPVPKHHIALSGPGWQTTQPQNFYNNSQCSQIIPIPGYPGGQHQVPMVPNAFQQTKFSESFRAHLQNQKHATMMMPPPTAANHQHQISNCSSSNTCSTAPYQPLNANYSSSGSNEELLDHVYSTLDSPKQLNVNEMSSNQNCSQSSTPQQRLINNNVNNNPSGINNSSTSDNSNSTSPPPPASGSNNNNGGTMYFV